MTERTRPGGLPIAACRERLARLRAHLADHGLAGALFTRPEHLRYLAGTHAGGLPAALLLTGTGAVFVAAQGAVLTQNGCEAAGIRNDGRKRRSVVALLIGGLHGRDDH